MRRERRTKGVQRGGPLSVRVNGRPLQAYEGETLHAALLAGGILTLRQSRRAHEPRGVFCGMGVCYECLVTINGRPGQRSCTTLVQEGMEVEIHEP